MEKLYLVQRGRWPSVIVLWKEKVYQQGKVRLDFMKNEWKLNFKHCNNFRKNSTLENH